MEIERDCSLTAGVQAGILASAQSQGLSDDVLDDIKYLLMQGHAVQVEPLNSHKYFAERRQYLTYRMTVVLNSYRQERTYPELLPNYFHISNLQHSIDAELMHQYLEKKASVLMAEGVERTMQITSGSGDFEHHEARIRIAMGQMLQHCAHFMALYKEGEKAAYQLGQQMGVIWDQHGTDWIVRARLFQTLCSMTNGTPLQLRPIHTAEEFWCTT